jgi:hypothetical protein
VEVSGPCLAVDPEIGENMLSFEFATSSECEFIASQFTISSNKGGEVYLLTNDSVRADETRVRLDAIYTYFFETDSSVTPIA